MAAEGNISCALSSLLSLDCTHGNIFCLVTWLRVGQSGVQIPAGLRDFSVLQNIQTGSGTNQVSYSIGTGVISWR
jgi:hypothetical protein